MTLLEEHQALLFQRELEERAGLKLNLKINDNHSTMLSVKWEPDCAKVSLHRMFLRAPYNIMNEVACYLKGENRILGPRLKAYIEANLQQLDYSHQLNLSKLETKGAVYDLQKIYDQLNRDYFQGLLKLHITWFGKGRKRPKNRFVFGLYHDPLRLIKINRMIDHSHFPEYFVSFIVYHEMLHHVCPPYVDEKGYKHIHSKEFKQREQQFKHFKLAEEWMKLNRHDLFEKSHEII